VGDGRGKGKGTHKGQGEGPLGVPTEERYKMETTLSPLSKEDFEIFSRENRAEKIVDYLLDMCSTPHHRKKLNEGEEQEGETFSLNGRPYDHPRQIRIRPIVTIDISSEERDVSEYIEYDGDAEGRGDEGETGNFEASDLEDGKEQPSREENPDKLRNAINNVPNQNAPALLQAVKKDLMESAYTDYFKSQLNKFGVSSPSQLSDADKKKFFNTVNKGWKAKNESAMSERAMMVAATKMINPLAKKMNALALARRAKGLPPLSRKQLGRLVATGA